MFEISIATDALRLQLLFFSWISLDSEGQYVSCLTCFSFYKTLSGQDAVTWCELSWLVMCLQLSMLIKLAHLFSFLKFILIFLFNFFLSFALKENNLSGTLTSVFGENLVHAPMSSCVCMHTKFPHKLSNRPASYLHDTRITAPVGSPQEDDRKASRLSKSFLWWGSGIIF